MAPVWSESSMASSSGKESEASTSNTITPPMGSTIPTSSENFPLFSAYELERPPSRRPPKQTVNRLSELARNYRASEERHREAIDRYRSPWEPFTQEMRDNLGFHHSHALPTPAWTTIRTRSPVDNDDFLIERLEFDSDDDEYTDKENERPLVVSEEENDDLNEMLEGMAMESEDVKEYPEDKRKNRKRHASDGAEKDRGTKKMK